jgi:glycosyltransferase involved in cell wall biosynthesis
MKVSVIIPFYKDTEALGLILDALNKQSALGCFEVIIAEDDNAPETLNFINEFMPHLTYPLLHISQEDKGYRRSAALNNGIRIASGELIVFIDGDCIPHKHFIKNYIRHAKIDTILYGRRVNLGRVTSEKIRKTKNLNLLSIPNLLFSDSSRVSEGFYFPNCPDFLKSKRQPWGCNLGAMKKNIEAINGYDEDFKEWGPEDLDFCNRLIRSGCKTFSVKYASILFHLYHKTKSNEELIARGELLLEKKRKTSNFFCENGLIKKLKP